MMKKPLLFLLIGVSFFTLTLFLSDNSQAQEDVHLKPPLDTTTIEGVIAGMVNFLFTIGVVLAPLLIIIGGFLFVTAGGNLEQINRGKKIILWTIIGFLIILLAQGIIQVVEDLLGVTSAPGSAPDGPDGPGGPGGGVLGLRLR